MVSLNPADMDDPPNPWVEYTELQIQRVDDLTARERHQIEYELGQPVQDDDEPDTQRIRRLRQTGDVYSAIKELRDMGYETED